jgi:NADH dehydrogenase
MTKNPKIATIFGGTGFIGRQIVRVLARAGYNVKVATRIPESAYFLRPLGTVGQIVPVGYRASDPASVASALRGSQVVINAIGILNESRRASFQRIHVEVPAILASAAIRQDGRDFIHFSATGLEHSQAIYAKSKVAGERSVTSFFPRATIMRPSLVFGEDDNFFNKFAGLIDFLPFLPLIGGGHTKFQPVYVADVADAVLAAISINHNSQRNGAHSRIFELGGPEIVSFKQIFERILKHTHKYRPMLTIPFSMAKLQGRILSLLPDPLLTADQVELLKTDNVVDPDMPGFEALGIEPSSMDSILPRYLSRYRAGGLNAAMRERTI